MKKIISILCLLFSSFVLAHAPASGTMGVKLLDWPQAGINKTYAIGNGLDFGFGLSSDSNAADVKQLDNRKVLSGGYLAFDVDDSFAFDIDETVIVEVRVDTKDTPVLWLGYDKNSSTGTIQSIPLDYEKDVRWKTVRFELERARFANRGFKGTDLVLASNPRIWSTHTVRISNIRLIRSHKTAKAPTSGQLKLHVRDVKNKQTLAVRAGLYDHSGRQPLSFNSDINMDWDDEKLNHVGMRHLGQVSWPHSNRYVTYSDGESQYELPAGNYQLILMKGPEYKVIEKNIEIETGKTLALDLTMEHWRDMSTEQWFSGDVHNHHIRLDKKDNQRLMAIAHAEDLNVFNTLSMGNATAVGFAQKQMGQAGQFTDHQHALVSGQEDPRTHYLGHTLSLNIDNPVRFTEEYLKYKHAYDEVHQLNGLFGYAHLDGFMFDDKSGLALDVIEGGVDFVEIIQYALLRTETWYDYLNLGFKIAPAAGSDWPYLGLPGDMRSYVYQEQDGQKKGFNSQGWFDGLQSGHTFATNGPMLELSVNGKPMGSILKLNKGDTVKITANASINPTFDKLASLDLIVGGDVVKTVSSTEGKESLNLEAEITVDSGTWIAIKAQGFKRPPKFSDDIEAFFAGLLTTGHYTLGSVAHSGPVYVHVDDYGSLVRGKAAASLEKVTKQLEGLSKKKSQVIRDLEVWETREKMRENINKTDDYIQHRARHAIEKYKNLLPLNLKP